MDSEADCRRAVERMAGWGVGIAVLSLGAEGAIAAADGRCYRVLPPPVDEVIAAMCWAASRGSDARTCLAWGTAAGAANVAVWDPGRISRQEVERLLPEVRIVEL